MSCPRPTLALLLLFALLGPTAAGCGGGSVEADPPPSDPLAVPPPPPAGDVDDAAFVLFELAAEASCGATLAGRVVFFNSGDLAWRPAEGVALAVHPDSMLGLVGGGASVALAADVPPGQSATFSPQLVAAPTAGSFVVRLQMKRHGVLFGEPAHRVVEVTCASPPPPPPPPPGAPGLEVHPDNPHYFRNTATGDAVLIAGFGSLVPSDYGYDYAAGIDELAAGGIRYARVWHLLPWAETNAIWPWARSSTPGAYLGGNKYDFNQWNPEYWSRLRDALGRAEAKGILAEIHLFDRCGMSPAAWSRWANNPWASDNNVNQLETPAGAEDGTPEFYELGARPRLFAQQERYVRKMIDETAGFGNVIYEVENEHWQSNDPAFGEHFATLVNDHLAAHYPGRARLVTYNSLQGDLESFYESDAVTHVNVHFGGGAAGDPAAINAYLEAHWGFGKPVNIDEFGNGVTDAAALRRTSWTIIASGGHFHIEDAAPSAQPMLLAANVNAFVRESGWRFVDAAPQRSLVTQGAGSCMVNNGVEVVCYFTAGGSVALTLPAGTFALAWWNPRSGGFVGQTTFTHGGGSKALSTPDGSDWVVHLEAAAP